MKRLALLALLVAAGCTGSGTTTARTDDELVEDQAIAAEVNRALSRVEGVDRLKIQIEVVRGIVSLTGPVSDEASAKAACAAARRVDGVKGVRDLLERVDH
ncbi:MAG: BON domain-containing protein [Planctomycetota bacterium]